MKEMNVCFPLPYEDPQSFPFMEGPSIPFHSILQFLLFLITLALVLVFDILHHLHCLSASDIQLRNSTREKTDTETVQYRRLMDLCVKK